MPETSVTDVSAQTSRKLVRIEITATSSGTNAISDAKTNTSTSSAPTPAEERLGQEPRAALLAGRGRQRVQPGQVHRGAGDVRTAKRRLRAR